MITTVLFDVGDTLVRAAAPGTPVTELRAEPLEGVVRTLSALAHGHRLGAVTDTAAMSADDVRRALAGTGISELLEVVVTSSDVGARKPDPAGIQAALASLGAAPESALLVGDSDADEGAALAAGVRFARVATSAPGRAGPLSAALREALLDELGPFASASALVAQVDDGARAEGLAHHLTLTKPAGSLGRLEDLGVRLCAIAGRTPPPLPVPAAVAVFAGDHGVVASGVTPWPQEVTAQMVAGFVGGGAAINVLARQAGASVTVVDVGVATDLPAAVSESPSLLQRRVRSGTGDISLGPAMERAEALAALDVGAQVAHDLVVGGAAALVTGEMGIGNTTASAAVIAALTGAPASEVTGRGTGIDDRTLAHKQQVVAAAAARVPRDADAVRVLAEVGGLELAALAGFVVGGASHRVPVVVDGVIALAALACAASLCPDVLGYVVAGHRSTEPGATVVLDHLGLEPVLDLGLRLGEGSGACLALGPIEAAARLMREMATFGSSGISPEAG